ncbi:DUF1173 family protein [Janthinobacterium lividum]|uniref:DUF1173 family protein n=1 Tax=Janthinobacterium lividum TaxID=29581 RepID=UPI001595C173|nr:DUF1173 family protein [Janthinobacterium lividum]QKY12040.1 DUF1173 domain-containing protein [Janthinobacterium lividum]
MESPTYLVRGRRLTEGAIEMQLALSELHGTAERPRCLCMPGGVDMYIAKMDRCLLKRMPGTGHKHHPSCRSFEPEYSDSGLGELVGEAVVDNGDTATEIYVNFPLRKKQGYAIARHQSEKTEPVEVSVAPKKMSLRAVMHYLFDRAGFNRWSPAMEGKRNQAVIHKYIMEVAGSTRIKGKPLSEHLYVPEQFNEQRKAEIAERRRRKFASLSSQSDGESTGIGIVLGEFKGVAETANGKKVSLKHMADMPLFIDEKSWKKIERTFATNFLMKSADPGAGLRLVLCALVYAKSESAFLIHTASLLTTTANWIPIEDAHEAQLVHALTSAHRHFIKPLAYDSRHAVRFATALLLDAGPKPVPLHAISSFWSEEVKAEKATHLQSTPGAWVWVSGQPMPALPEPLEGSRPAPSSI